ncbi:hypothetical protein [Planctomicrobium sp. SH527]|uniref:hypothetical protein n=1 Tax=Planctomicrobium sp. SH527 TaxID=3448123 RepID=UPI003F5ADDDE
MSDETLVFHETGPYIFCEAALELLEISGYLITIVAISCQTDIAEKIVDAGADDVLAVKGNEPTLQSDIESFFMDHLAEEFAQLFPLRLIEFYRCNSLPTIGRIAGSRLVPYSDHSET